MDHKKHILVLIKLAFAGIAICLMILMYAFYLNWQHDKVNPTGEVFKPVAGNVYKSEKYGFEIVLPDNWIESPQINAVMEFAFVDNSYKGIFPIYIAGRYVVKDNLPQVGFDKQVDSSKKLYLEEVVSGEFLSDQKLTVNGLEARLLKIKAKKYDSKRTRVDDIIDYELFINTGVNNGIYLLLGGYKEELGARADKAVLDALMSFKVIPSQPGVYINKKYGIQMSVPNTWAEVDGLTESMDFGLADKTINDFPFVNGFYSDKKDLDGMSLDQIAESYSDPDSEAAYAQPKILSNLKITVDGLPARLVKTRAKNYPDNESKELIDYIYYSLFVDRGTGVQAIVTVYREKDAYKYDKIMLDLIASIKFLNK